MNLRNVIIETLQNEVKPAMGCTEPVAVALAAAKASAQLMGEEICELDIKVSPNIFKNGLGVGIPNSDYIGLDIAASLGAIGGDSDSGLKVLETITPDHEQVALALISEGKLKVSVADTDLKIYILAKVKSKNHVGIAEIKNKHDQITYVKADDQVVLKEETQTSKANYNADMIYESKISTIIETISEMDYESLAFLKDGIDMNLKMAEAGLSEGIGIGVGSGLMKSVEEGYLSKDLMTDAMILTAAASDARMSGMNLPVMSSNGSGNNGLTAILPIVAYLKRNDVSDEQLVKALAISHIINCYIKNQIGRLSALCGCSIAAATGATAALSWLMGSDQEIIEGAMKDMIADVSGTICDGAKLGCALKLSTAASVAVKYALLAKHKRIVPQRNGIIAGTIETTIDNLGRLSNEGMQLTDEVIFNIMKEMNEGQEIQRLHHS